MNKIKFSKSESAWFSKQRVLCKYYEDCKVENPSLNHDIIKDIQRYNKLYEDLKMVKAEIINKYYSNSNSTDKKIKKSKKKSCKQQCDEFMAIVLERFHKLYPDEKL